MKLQRKLPDRQLTNLNYFNIVRMASTIQLQLSITLFKNQFLFETKIEITSFYSNF